MLHVSSANTTKAKGSKALPAALSRKSLPSVLTDAFNTGACSQAFRMLAALGVEGKRT